MNWPSTNGQGSRPTTRWSAETATTSTTWTLTGRARGHARCTPQRWPAARPPASTATRASPTSCLICTAYRVGSEGSSRFRRDIPNWHYCCLGLMPNRFPSASIALVSPFPGEFLSLVWPREGTKEKATPTFGPAYGRVPSLRCRSGAGIHGTSLSRYASRGHPGRSSPAQHLHSAF